MGFPKSLHLLRSFRFYSSRRFPTSSSSSIMHWRTVNSTHSGGLLTRVTRLLSTLADTSEIECDVIVDEEAVKKKDTALHVALTQLESHFEKESMLSLPNFFIPRCASVISTGSLKLDLALGIGGLPKGRIVEIYGKEASGKTTLALHVIKEAQKLGGYCAYLDAENALDPILAEAIGVDTENLLVSCPDSAENMLSVVDKLTQSGSLDVIVVDSVAALVPQSEIDGDLGAGEPNVLSNIMTKALRRIHCSLCRTKTVIIFLNQVRYSPKPNQGFGKKDEATCGGKSLGFYAAVRLRISRTGLFKINEKVTGIDIRVQVMKNKLAPVLQSAELGINFGSGLRFEPEVLQLAIEHGLILKEGNSYFIEGEVFHSELAAERYLAENKEVFEKVVTDLRSWLFDRNS